MDYEHALHIFNSLYQDINGYSLSTRGRAELGIEDKAFTYGEIAPDAFYSILKNLPSKPKGIFYDLGSGTGKAVLLAHLLFEFQKSIGIELIEPLSTTAHHIFEQYNKEYSSLIPKNRIMELIQGDFTKVDFSDGDVVFMHSTCFPEYVWKKLEKPLKNLKNGAIVITVTRTAPYPFLEFLKSKEYGMAWGRATVHFYKKT